MPSARINGVNIHYDVIGQTGPWVATIPGGRNSFSLLNDLAQTLAQRGYRVVVHDRRNCGLSTFKFDTSAPEDDLWAHDLGALLEAIGARQTLIVGLSRGARVALKLALNSPVTIGGLLLWGLSGGPVAARYLDNYYYTQYIRAAETGGMEAVCLLDHFANSIAARAENRDLLMAIDPNDFLAAMRAWRAAFLNGVDMTVMGIDDNSLRRVSVPTVIVPVYDRMHPRETAQHAQRMIQGSSFVDFDPLRRDNPKMTQADWLHDQAIVAGILCDLDTSVGDRI